MVDDHQMFSDGLKKLIEEKIEFRVEKIFETFDALYYALQFSLPDILILDITIHGEENGIETAIKLLSKYTDLKILFLSMHKTLEYVIPAYKSGAYGYLLKNTNSHELFRALERIKLGDKYFSKEVMELVASQDKIQTNFSNSIKLTKREREILILVLDSFSSREIAEKLYLSILTVESHRKNILSKTGCKNSIELNKFRHLLY